MPLISQNQVNTTKKIDQNNVEIMTRLYALSQSEGLHESGDEIEIEYEESQSDESGQEYSLSTHKRNNIHASPLNDDSIDVSNLISRYRMATSLKDSSMTTSTISNSSSTQLPNTVIATSSSSKSKTFKSFN